MSSNPVIIQNPTPLTPDAASPNNEGQVLYTDLSYNIIPDISNNPTYTLRTNVTDDTYDVFQDSLLQPQAFVPNSLFISGITSAAGIARDNVGNFYVASGQPVIPPAASTISVYNSDGTSLIRTITLNSGNPGTGPNWSTLRYLAFDTSNNLYVSSESSHGIAYVAAGASTNDNTKTIFPPGNTPDYSNKCRGLAYRQGYLYIVIKQTSPAYVIKYNVSNNEFVLLDLSSDIPTGGAPNALVYNQLYTASPNPFLYLTSSNFGGGTGENKILGISQITGTEAVFPGGTGTAAITLLTSFNDTQYPYSIVVDNTGNLYCGLAINNTFTTGQIARLASTGTISNISNVALSPSGPITGRSYGLIFDGNLNLFLSDYQNSRVIKSQPKTFVFGGPSALNVYVYRNSSITTYLYNTTSNTSVTTFGLNIECFKKGTKILCENDVYVPIEDLKIGDLVKTYKHGYQKVIMYAHSRSCDYVQSIRNQIYTYPREKNPDLIEDLHLTGGHSLLFDTLTEEESTNMRKIKWAKGDFMVEDKYKLLACLSSDLYIAAEQHVEIYHFTLEPPENAKPSHVYGVYANGVLVESCSKGAMEQTLRENKMLCDSSKTDQE